MEPALRQDGAPAARPTPTTILAPDKTSVRPGNLGPCQVSLLQKLYSFRIVHLRPQHIPLLTR